MELVHYKDSSTGQDKFILEINHDEAILLQESILRQMRGWSSNTGRWEIPECPYKKGSVIEETMYNTDGSTCYLTVAVLPNAMRLSPYYKRRISDLLESYKKGSTDQSTRIISSAEALLMDLLNKE